MTACLVPRAVTTHNYTPPAPYAFEYEQIVEKPFAQVWDLLIERLPANGYKIIKAEIMAGRHDDVNWFLAESLNRENRIRYACYAAKQVLHIFEEKFPADKRPRLAVNAATACIPDTAAAARATARDAAAAAGAAWTSGDAGAARAAEAAAEAAWTSRAAVAAGAAAEAAGAAGGAMLTKIFNYGWNLLKKQAATC